MSLDDRMRGAATRLEGATIEMEVPENDVRRRARTRALARTSTGVVVLVVVAVLAVSMTSSGHKTADVANGRGRLAAEFQSLVAKRNSASATVTFLDKFTGIPDRTRTLSQDGKGKWSQKIGEESSIFYSTRDNKVIECVLQPHVSRETTCGPDTGHGADVLKDIFSGKSLKQWTDAIARGDDSLRFTAASIAGHSVLCASRIDGSTHIKTCLDERTGVVLASYQTDKQGPHDSVAVSVRDATPSDFLPPTPAGNVLHVTVAPGGALAFLPPTLTATTGSAEIDVTFAAPGHTFGFHNPEVQFTELHDNTVGTQKGVAFFPKAGDYEYFCSIPGHEAAGERGVVHVTGPDVTPPFGER